MNVYVFIFYIRKIKLTLEIDTFVDYFSIILLKYGLTCFEVGFGFEYFGFGSLSS